MDENIFGLEFDKVLGDAEIMYDSPDYREIPHINMDDFIYHKSQNPNLEMLVDH